MYKKILTCLCIFGLVSQTWRFALTAQANYIGIAAESEYTEEGSADQPAPSSHEEETEDAGKSERSVEVDFTEEKLENESWETSGDEGSDGDDTAVEVKEEQQSGEMNTGIDHTEAAQTGGKEETAGDENIEGTTAEPDGEAPSGGADTEGEMLTEKKEETAGEETSDEEGTKTGVSEEKASGEAGMDHKDQTGGEGTAGGITSKEAGSDTDAGSDQSTGETEQSEETPETDQSKNEQIRDDQTEIDNAKEDNIEKNNTRVDSSGGEEVTANGGKSDVEGTEITSREGTSAREEVEESSGETGATGESIGGGMTGTAGVIVPASTEAVKRQERPKDVVSLRVPDNINFTIDQYGLKTGEQVYSKRYLFRNTGDQAILLRLSDIRCVADDSVVVVSDEKTDEEIRASDEKVIRLILTFDNEDSLLVLEDGSDYEVVLEAKTSLRFWIGGCMSNSDDVEWQDGDVGIEMIYGAQIYGEETEDAQNETEN